MIEISNRQSELLEAAIRRRFIEKMSNHLVERYPTQCAALDRAQLSKSVKDGFERAEAFGLTDKENISHYISAAFLLGRHFDEDPLYLWIEETLYNHRQPNPDWRMEALYEDEDLPAFLDKLWGGDEKPFLKAAWKRLSTFKVDASMSTENPDFEAKIVALWENIYPEKCEMVGLSSLEALVDKALLMTQKYHLSNERAVICYLTLSFMCGIGCHQDFQYPWIQSILCDSSMDSEQQANQLEEALRKYFSMLANKH